MHAQMRFQSIACTRERIFQSAARIRDCIFHSAALESHGGPGNAAQLVVHPASAAKRERGGWQPLLSKNKGRVFSEEKLRDFGETAVQLQVWGYVM